jgi:hypothetical protein
MPPSSNAMITWRNEPAMPAQNAAWQKLWLLLLREEKALGPEMAEGSGGRIPEPSNSADIVSIRAIQLRYLEYDTIAS